LNNPKLLLFGELDQRIEDDTGSKGETDEGDGSDAQMSINEDIGENATCTPGSVQGITPRVVDQVSKLREDCGMDGL